MSKERHVPLGVRPSRMHILGHPDETTLASRGSAAGRTWSTWAKLSAKLRKIVSDTSTGPWYLHLSLLHLLAFPFHIPSFPSLNPFRLSRGVSRSQLCVSFETSGQYSHEAKRTRGEGTAALYSVHSSLIYGRRGDSKLVYVIDTHQIHTSIFLYIYIITIFSSLLFFSYPLLASYHATDLKTPKGMRFTS